MPKITVTNTSSVPLNGKRPGESFSIDVDDAGVPLDFFWRRRFEEGAHKKGYLAVDAAKSPAPVASPEAQKPKAR